MVSRNHDRQGDKNHGGVTYDALGGDAFNY